MCSPISAADAGDDRNKETKGKVQKFTQYNHYLSHIHGKPPE